MMVSDPLPDRCLGLCGDMLVEPFRAHILPRFLRRVLTAVGDTDEGEVEDVVLQPQAVGCWGCILVRRRPVVTRPDERGK